MKKILILTGFFVLFANTISAKKQEAYIPTSVYCTAPTPQGYEIDCDKTSGVDARGNPASVTGYKGNEKCRCDWSNQPAPRIGWGVANPPSRNTVWYIKK